MICADELTYIGLDAGDLIPFDSLRKCYFTMISKILRCLVPFGRTLSLYLRKDNQGG